jgi:hypothetical protein
MFKVGDKVKVINPLDKYSCYEEWARRYGFHEEFFEGNCRNYITICPGDIGTIFAVGKHLDMPSKIIYGVHFENINLKTIMGAMGIVLVESVKLQKEYPHICSKCGSPSFNNLMSTDCSNPNCR